MHIFNVSGRSTARTEAKSVKKYLHTRPNVMLGPEEDAGIVFFTGSRKRYGIVMAHESHNHPLAGATRGRGDIGGIVRELTVWARVIATGDPLRFGNPMGAAPSAPGG